MTMPWDSKPQYEEDPEGPKYNPWPAIQSGAAAIGQGISNGVSAVQGALPQKPEQPAQEGNGSKITVPGISSFWPGSTPATPAPPSFQDDQRQPAPYSPPPAPKAPPDPAEQATLDNIRSETEYNAAKAAEARAAAAKAQAAIAASTDPNSVEYQTAQAQLATAQAALQHVQLQIEELRRQAAQLTPEQQIRLTDELGRGRDRAAAELADSRSAAERAFTRGENQANRDFQSDLAAKSQAVTVWDALLKHGDSEADRAERGRQFDLQYQFNNSELDYRKEHDTKQLDLETLKEEHDFSLRTIANQVAKGELSLKKANAKFDQWLSKSKLPFEQEKMKSEAVAPYLPFATSMKDGDIPAGFEGGGPMEQLVNAGGGSYNPSTYAVHPTSVGQLWAGQTPGNGTAGTPAAQPSPAPAPAPAAPAPAPAAPPMAAPGQGGAPPMVKAMLPTGTQPNGEEIARLKAAIGGATRK